jgi:hypothetical protein
MYWFPFYIVTWVKVGRESQAFALSPRILAKGWKLYKKVKYEILIPNISS